MPALSEKRDKAGNVTSAPPKAWTPNLLSDTVDPSAIFKVSLPKLTPEPAYGRSQMESATKS